MKSRFRLSVASLATVAALTLAACGDSSGADAATGDAGTAGNGGASSDSANATSLADFGDMDGLVAAANAEGQLNIIALPHDWSNWGEVIALFKETYPEITVNEQNPNASSQEEIDAMTTNAGTDAAPDVVDIGLAVATANTDMFAKYRVGAWDQIPDAIKNADGRYWADYTGIMSIGYNKSLYGEITSLEDLMDPQFAGTVALNGKPAEAGAAFNGFVMANIASGGTLEDLQPGLDYFAGLMDAGNLTTVDVTNATIDSGQTGVVFDWSYNHKSHQDRLAGMGVEWEYFVPAGAEVASYYNQAINKDAPHPAAARLWQEFLYSPDAQNLWLKGGSTPVLQQWMIDEGTINEEYLADALELSGEPTTYDSDTSARITEFLQGNWDATIGN